MSQELSKYGFLLALLVARYAIATEINISR